MKAKIYKLPIISYHFSTTKNGLLYTGTNSRYTGCHSLATQNDLLNTLRFSLCTAEHRPYTGYHGLTTQNDLLNTLQLSLCSVKYGRYTSYHSRKPITLVFSLNNHISSLKTQLL